ncbi:SDR family NAD(P)-dependent oxidoreductase [Alkaliflexus imshenetskii]|uniref:SDR family NAD(P)-dependent oxidoreductase n=1 Tax=Alkaliflexus imshenetskii TaxID=286730 RepID=UPI00047BA1F3|nr:SDR family oxidoreductase [Alkaliflexus imshenetskii]
MKGKKVVVTGGANGIGYAIAEAFASLSAEVWVVDKDEAGIRPLLARYGSLRFTKLDISNSDDIVTFFQRLHDDWGFCDVLVNNAGVSCFSELEACSTAFWDDVIAVNLRAPFVFAREFARLHPKGCYGRIVNIASTRYIMSEPGGEAYGASKGGLVSLTHALANSLAGTGITVNCIAPGWIHTGNKDELSEADHAQHPSARVGTSADVARIVMFLCQPDNDFINGEEIRADGGMTRKMIYI